MTIDRARNLRRRMSLPEATLWNILRADAFTPFHFRRQVQLGPFYADFASHRAKLVIEVDGSQHSADGEIAYDARRDAFIRRQGFRVLHVTTLDVLTNLDGVATTILAHLPHPPASPVPPPHKGEG
ncbi:MAG TPA: DUF559 domain-containing protein [Devosia sp.]